MFCVVFGDDHIKNNFIANSSVGVFTYLELIQVIVDFIYYAPTSAISYSMAYIGTEPKGRCLCKRACLVINDVHNGWIITTTSNHGACMTTMVT